MFILITIFWLIWEIKYVLFWLYLWQLKDYHVARFVDHFRTFKGKKVFLNIEQSVKIFLLLLLLLNTDAFSVVFAVLLFIYIVESAIAIRSVIKKSLKVPQKTAKILFLGAITFVSVLGFLLINTKFSETKSLLLLLLADIILPIFVAIVVLLFQPIFVLLRNNVLAKARVKLNSIRAINNIKVVAITGSYGKTSTKEFLTTILSTKYRVLSTKDHQNSEIGIAKCILDNLKPSHQIFIAEVGAYDKGKVKQVCNILKPNLGIVTGVNEQHLALFGSMGNLLSAEGGVEMAEILAREAGKLFVNGNNKYCLDLYKDFSGEKKIYCEDNSKIDADTWADSPSVTQSSISFIGLNKSGQMAHFQASVLGKQNIQNLLGAISVAHELSMSFGEISDACNRIEQKQAGMAVKIEKNGINIIDSSYSSNPDGVYADLEYLSLYGGKKVIVMPCLIELGKISKEIHSKIGKQIGKTCDLAIITSKDNFEDINVGIKEVSQKTKCVFCDNAQDIYSLITLSCKQGDAVLLEGRVPAKLNELF